MTGIKLITSPEQYFLESLDAAYKKYPNENEWMVKPYLAKVLTKFLISDSLWVQEDNKLKHPTLAFLLKEAVETEDLSIQKQKYQHLGDVALYISGVFPDSLNRKLVDVDYYIQMGSSAYLKVYQYSEVSGVLFNILSHNFNSCLDLLSEATNVESSEKNILRLFELYSLTKSSKVLKQLQDLGFNPLDFNKKPQ